MKRRVSKILNFFAFNLLFFALYLNFIHKDSSSIPMATQQPAFSETASVENTMNSEEKVAAPGVSGISKVSPEEMAAMKLPTE
ncbi:MAG TPA: hypothetical protein VEB63_04400 [Chitinophagaceae bacterium]|nr:hypothetical protein [Chitinophagaceae bacterium]